jgi:hypothetical protein
VTGPENYSIPEGPPPKKKPPTVPPDVPVRFQVDLTDHHPAGIIHAHEHPVTEILIRLGPYDNSDFYRIIATNDPPDDGHSGELLIIYYGSLGEHGEVVHSAGFEIP